MLVKQKGFTLVEVIVVLAVVAILAAIAVPAALRIFQVTAEEGTREEMDGLKKAMIGDPRKLQSSFRSDFGFLGDIGCLPANLDRILTQGALPAFSFNTTLQAGAGWKGPYITGAAVGEEPEDFKNDQLGNPYTYTPAAGPCPLTATLTSNGPDGAFSTSDDITLSLIANETTGTIRGTVKDAAGNPLAVVPMNLIFPSNGGLSVVTVITDANGNYSFTSVPFGQRSVQVDLFSALIVLSPGSVTISPTGRDITFVILNLSSSTAAITDIRADFTGGANYDRIRIDKTIVDNGNNFVSGQVVDIDDTTIAANPVVKGPLRVFVDSPDAIVPDFGVGQGQAATIELERFSQDMTGIPILVFFFNGATLIGIVSFTP